MTRPECAQILAILGEMYSGEISKLKAEIFFKLLEPYEFWAVEKAVFFLLMTRKYSSFPQPADIISELEGNPADRSLLAWDEARRAIVSVGIYRSVSFRDKITNGVIDAMGGWEKFCSMLVEEEPFRQKDFVNLYSAILKTGRHCPERLTGWHERLNGAPEETVMIGADKGQKQIEAKNEN